MNRIESVTFPSQSDLKIYGWAKPMEEAARKEEVFVLGEEVSVSIESGYFVFRKNDPFCTVCVPLIPEISLVISDETPSPTKVIQVQGFIEAVWKEYPQEYRNAISRLLNNPHDL